MTRLSKLHVWVAPVRFAVGSNSAPFLQAAAVQQAWERGAVLCSGQVGAFEVANMH